ncbi:MAG: endonuclease NucS [Acidobacteriia bacterium]|nr:endonuclease NucS [Terriglobia bacterium]
MNKFQFTEEQINSLNAAKASLNTPKALDWAADEEKAEVLTAAVLNDESFKNGQDLSPDTLDELFSNMKCFSRNRNLSNLLYRKNGLETFNAKLRSLIHGAQPFPQRVNDFFKMQLIGLQTMSQFLVVSNTREYPFVTAQTKEGIGVSSEQDEQALDDALELFKVTNKDAFLDRTLDYLRDYVIFRAVKNAFKLEKYTTVNNLLWFAFGGNAGEEGGPEEVIKDYGAIRMENDLRDYLAANIFLVEKGLTLVGKEYDTREAGRIDLLCKDKSGAHVVIELKKGRIGHEVVGQALKYIGWVQKNLNKKARGIIIVNEPDDKLNYAALPLGELVKVKFYKVSFDISDEYPVKG